MASSSVCSISCSLCSVALPNACDRRLLHSAASSPVLNTVRGVATELFFCDVDEVLSTWLPSLPCMRLINRAVEKLSTLRQKQGEDLRELVERAGKAKGTANEFIGTTISLLPAAVPVLAFVLAGSSLVLQPLQLLPHRATSQSAFLRHTCPVYIAYFIRCSSCEARETCYVIFGNIT